MYKAYHPTYLVQQLIFFSLLELIQVGYDPTVYTTSESEGIVELNIFVFSHPADGTPRPFNLSVNTLDGSAGVLSIHTKLSHHQ